MPTWLRFALAALATWRIAHLLVREDGPGEIVARVRRRLGDGFWGRLMDCFKCVSVWIAAPLALFVTTEPVAAAVVWLALSGAAILLEEHLPETLLIEEEEAPNGLLRGSQDDLGDQG